MTYETILLDVDPGGVALITLNRPATHNALNRAMVDDLHAALEALEDRADVRALILASASEKAFMSGADIAELRERRREDALQGINSTLFARVEEFPRPTVAAVRGWCLGGGMELVLCCDFRVVSIDSRFGQPEVGLGIMAAAGGTRRLPALVGLAQARRLLFSGRIIDAEEALRIGLVDHVVPAEQVRGAARELLDPILEQSPEAVRRTKETLQAWIHGEDEARLRLRDNETQALLFEHPEKFERMDAFLAKREAKKKR